MFEFPGSKRIGIFVGDQDFEIGGLQDYSWRKMIEKLKDVQPCKLKPES